METCVDKRSVTANDQEGVNGTVAAVLHLSHNMDQGRQVCERVDLTAYDDVEKTGTHFGEIRLKYTKDCFRLNVVSVRTQSDTDLDTNIHTDTMNTGTELNGTLHHANKENGTKQPGIEEDNGTVQLGSEEDNGTVQLGSEEDNGTVQPCSEEDNGTVQLGSEEDNGTVQLGSEGDNGTVQLGSEEDNGTVQLGSEEDNGTVQLGSERDNGTVQLGSEEDNGTVQPSSEEENETVQPCGEEENETVQPCSEEEKGTVQHCGEGEKGTVQLGSEEEKGTVQPCSEEENETVQPCSEEENETERLGEYREELKGILSWFDSDVILESHEVTAQLETVLLSDDQPQPHELSDSDTGLTDDDQVQTDDEDDDILENHDECQICYGNDWTDRRVCCQFRICSRCFSRYVESKVSGGIVLNIQCPNSSCHIILREHEISASLSASSKMKYHKFLTDARNDPTGKTCPRCGHPKHMDRKSLKKTTGVMVICQTCALQWCFSCHAPWHEGATCKESGDQRGDREFRKWTLGYGRQIEVNAHRCPTCKVYIQRSSGCNHMVCSRCATDFCYDCGQKYYLTRTNHNIYSNRLFKYTLGTHSSKLSPLGCSHNFLRKHVAARRLIRGSVLGAL